MKKYFLLTMLIFNTLLLAKKSIIYIPMLGLQSTLATPNVFLHTIGDTKAEGKAIGPTRFDINQTILSQLLIKSYTNFTDTEAFSQAIPYKHHFMLPIKKGILVVRQDELQDKSTPKMQPIADFNIPTTPFSVYENTLLDHLNRYANAYALSIRQIDKKFYPQEGNSTEQTPFSSSEFSAFSSSELYALAIYMDKPQGKVNIKEQNREDNLLYHIESQLSINMKLIIYKYDYINKKFRVSDIIESMPSSVTIPSSKAFTLDTRKIKLQVAKDFMVKYQKAISSLREQFNRSENITMDNGQLSDSESNATAETMQSMPIVPTINFYDQEATISKMVEDDIFFEFSSPLTNPETFRIDQPFGAYDANGSMTALTRATNREDFVVTALYGEVAKEDTLKPLSYSGGSLSLYGGIDRFTIGLKDTEHTEFDLNKTRIEPYFGLAYSANLGFKFGADWLSHTYLNMYVQGKYNFKKR